MNQQQFGVALAALVVLGLGGCSAFGGGKAEDNPARTRAALEVPPDLARPAGDDTSAAAPGGVATYSDYAKPAAPAAAAAAAAPVATPGTSTPASARVRLERDGAQRWLVVQDTPENVFAKARAYLLRNNYKLIVDNPKTGLLETDWVDRPVEFSGVFSKILASLSSTGLRDKFRIRTEAGRTASTTEVYVSQQGLEEVVMSTPSYDVKPTTWQPRASDPMLEADLLARLMVDFGLDSQQAKNELASAATARAQLVKNSVILSGQDFDSSWRRVGQAMDRSGVTIEDLDRNAGIYYVHYVPRKGQKSSGGVFGLFGGSGSDSKDEAAHDRFQVALKTQTDGTGVTIRDVKGESDDSTEAAALLQLLYQQLR